MVEILFWRWMENSLQQTMEIKEEAALWEQLNVQMCRMAHWWLQHDLDGYNLTVPQYMTLRNLYECGQGCSMTDLADSSGQVPATMTGIIDRLMDRGLVERQRDLNDRRALRVLLTPAGKHVIAAVNAAKRELVERVMSSLNEEERQAMTRTTRHYLDVMQKMVQLS
jgi:DNA-binding MarR family transcriptional regulator